jgi:hypothetical protein
MSGAVLRNFQVSIFDCRSFLGGDDPGTNRKSGFELVPLTLAQMKFRLIKYVPGGIRTPNLLIRSQKLYPVELQAQMARQKVTNVTMLKSFAALRYNDVTLLTI